MPTAPLPVRCAIFGVLLYASHAIAQPDAAALFRANCASCHGANLQGTGLGPPLAIDSYRYGGGIDDFRRIIRSGMASRGMPAFGATLSADEVDTLAAYLPARSAIPEPEDATATPAPRVFDPVPGVVETLDYAIRVERFAAGLQTVWAMEFIDADTALVSERGGRLRMIRRGELLAAPVRDTPEVHVADHPWNQGGLLDIALDPDHARNGWIYLSYSHRQPREEADEAQTPVRAMTRVVRGRIVDDAWVDQQIVFEAEAAAYGETFWHYGGRLAFDAQARLYLTVGDRGAQELAREPGRPTGKVHRLLGDGSAPSDNPFRDRADALASVYSLGHRNPQGLVFDAVGGRLWSTEHGPRGGDELNLIDAGADYGWPVATFGINYDGTPITPHTHAEGVTQPVHYWRPSIGVSGLALYRGREFPLWNGKLLVTALAPRELRVLTLDGTRVQHEEVLLRTAGRPYEPVVGPDGAIYLVTDDPGEILRLSAQQERRR